MKYAVIDFETTGSLPQDEIIQIGLCLIENEKITASYDSLIKPNQPIPETITKLTGISDQMVEDAPSLEEALSELLPFLENAVFVAHHAAFDLGFLQRALDECGYSSFDGPVLDTVDMLRFLFPELPSLQLSMVSSYFHIEHSRPHQADSDAFATAQIFIRCLDKLAALPYLTLQRLTDLFSEPQAGLYDLKWWLTEQLRERERSNRIHEPAIAYRQWALNVEDWSDEERSTDERERPASFDSFYEQLVESMKQKFPNYEERKAQVEMIYKVKEAFENDRHLIVEAGTGTGKSLGYLIPSIYYSLKNEERVTVSTHTINLQEQIRQRDLPLLHEIVPIPFHAALLKGRSHYLCLRKFEHKINGKEYESNKESVLWAAQMVIWLSETTTGDEEEIHFTPKGQEAWKSVASDADSCLNRSCPWFRKCFYHRARSSANQADIVITNHSLLFTDQKAEHRLLPSYKHLIVDEAHQFEETAGKHLGKEFHYFSMVNALLWLSKEGSQGRLPQLKQRIEFSGLDQAEKWADSLELCMKKTGEMILAWDALFEYVYKEWLLPIENESSQETGQAVLRLKPSDLPKMWEEVKELEKNVHTFASEILKTLQCTLDEIKQELDDYDVQSVLTDIQGTLKEIQRCRDDLRFFVMMENKHDVYWIDASTAFRHKSMQFCSVPIDVSKMLKEMFFDAKDSIVLTSATLSVNRNFEYLKEQVGLTDAKQLEALQLPSPFNYRKNALVCIPRDFPKLKGKAGEEEYVEELISSTAEVAQITSGRMLILFTSYKMLKEVHSALKIKLQSSNIQVLGQGVDSNNRSKLTKWFMDRPNSILLGTSSFWEGVDIPGDALSCLCIVRLPFQPPNHPMAEAKFEYLREKKKNPFMDYSVPQAVIRFKQGFGRLIRTSSDRGIVIIYDTRVIDTYYGKHFLYSLPGPKIEHMSKQRMVERIDEWLHTDKDQTVLANKGE